MSYIFVCSSHKAIKDLKYSTWVIWDTFVILYCDFFVMLKLESSSSHSLSLFGKELPQYSSEMQLL